MACQPKTNSKVQFVLLPSPTAFTISGESKLKALDLESNFQSAKNNFTTGKLLSEFEDEVFVFALDSGMQLPAEGYSLSITAQKIEIKAPTNAGLWYGLMTLGQLLQDAKDQNTFLPICHIDDEPALAEQARDQSRVRCEAHANDDRGRLAHKRRDGLLEL